MPLEPRHNIQILDTAVGDEAERNTSRFYDGSARSTGGTLKLDLSCIESGFCGQKKSRGAKYEVPYRCLTCIPSALSEVGSILYVSWHCAQ